MVTVVGEYNDNGVHVDLIWWRKHKPFTVTYGSAGIRSPSSRDNPPSSRLPFPTVNVIHSTPASHWDAPQQRPSHGIGATASHACTRD